MKVLLGISILVLAFMLAVTPASAVDVEAYFDGGGTDASPVTDVVDAYTGMPGGGWSRASSL